MRKVILEIPRAYLGKAAGAESVESMSIVQLFKSDAKAFSGICRLKATEGKRLKELVGSLGMTKIVPLSREKDGAYIAYVEGRPMAHWFRPSPSKEGYHLPPFELTPKAWRKTLLGSDAQVRKSLSRLEESGLRFKIVWAGEARFKPSSLASSLTEGQKRTLSAAYKMGYYDFPRRAGSDRLAKALKLSKATVSEQLRRAERALLDQVFAE